MTWIFYTVFRPSRFIVLLFVAFSATSLVAQHPDINPRVAQQQLKDHGFDVGVVDGVWGPRSAQALRDFQRSVGLQASGRIDALTKEKLATEPLRSPAPVSVRVEPSPRPTEANDGARPSPVIIEQPPAGQTPPPLYSSQPQPQAPASSSPRSSTSSLNDLNPHRSTSDSSGTIIKVLVVLGLIWVLRGYWKRPTQKANGKNEPKQGPSEASQNGRLWQHNSADSEFSSRLAAYDSAISQMLSHHQAQPNKISISAAIQVDPLPLSKSEPGFFQMLEGSQRSKAGWKAHSDIVEIAGLRIAGGWIYVGTSLPRSDGRCQENCLINPNLPVGRSADAAGVHLDYWPSYSDLKPSSRRALLEWLAGPRADPATPIGYVFLYFYGLERRLMLEAISIEEGAELTAEVRRLVSIYGDNQSFNHYASALLSALGFRNGAALSEVDFQGYGYEVPIGLLVALGQRAKEMRAIEPDLLHAFARAHPQTRLRTPAKRAQAEHRELFHRAVERTFQNGVVLKGWRHLPKLKAVYRAASGSFELDLLPPKHGLPDLTNMSEPMPTIRRLFEECSNELDRYSRELGRSNGMKPTLSTITRLPVVLRDGAADRLAGRPMVKLKEWAVSRSMISAQELAAVLGADVSAGVDKSALRELASVLGSLGFGMTEDPQFALRRSSDRTPVEIFVLEGRTDSLAPPSDAFRLAQMSLALGLMVAAVDGELSPPEITLLARQASSHPDLSENEKRRLMAELRAYTADPLALGDLRSRMKDLPLGVRKQLAENVIAITVADGVIDPREVSFIEKLFKQINLETSDLYGRLHARLAESGQDASSASAGLPARARAEPQNGIDHARLATIRAETANAAAVLSAIFAEDEDLTANQSPSPAPAPIDDRLDGLDCRHHALVLELSDRQEWPRIEFERVVRSTGLMPGAALTVINEWALDRFDDRLIEGDEMVWINRELLPTDFRRENA